MNKEDFCFAYDVARVRKELYWKHERAFGSNSVLQQLFIDAASDIF